MLWETDMFYFFFNWMSSETSVTGSNDKCAVSHLFLLDRLEEMNK